MDCLRERNDAAFRNRERVAKAEAKYQQRGGETGALREVRGDSYERLSRCDRSGGVAHYVVL